MTIYKDNSKKYVIILNRKIEVPNLFNAVGHIAAGISSLTTSIDQMEYLEYIDGDGTRHPAISRFPIIILSSDNSNQIRKIRGLAIEKGILFNDFTDTMHGYSAENQLHLTRSKKECELEYYALILFGDAEALNQLTKKFSLYR